MLLFFWYVCVCLRVFGIVHNSSAGSGVCVCMCLQALTYGEHLRERHGKVKIGGKQREWTVEKHHAVACNGSSWICNIAKQ